ncbi:hypothetical protein PIROE2DRAFT_4817 [Piromyces sp. E2]|nr:hypothetical protein PIROE2DRAFT_4817 [Piromyces sp. E2]|eukprot:OUM67651.1 hypothetical protein PIROE2DRAFT_4817 [Piromyces sp. E2]
MKFPVYSIIITNNNGINNKNNYNYNITNDNENDCNINIHLEENFEPNLIQVSHSNFDTTVSESDNNSIDNSSSVQEGNCPLELNSITTTVLNI